MKHFILPLLLTLTIFSCAIPKYLKCPKGIADINIHKPREYPVIIVNGKRTANTDSINGPVRIRVKRNNIIKVRTL